MPHSLTVDKDDNIWVTDVGLQPTDVAVASDGCFYVSDGYRNSRVVKFSATGKYLLSWGSKGDGPGQFDLPHGLDLDGPQR